MTAHPRPCIVCGQPCERSRCPEHELPDRRPSRAVRDRETRRRTLIRARKHRNDPRCAACHIPHELWELDLDHIVPQWAGGKLTSANTQLLCGTCHREKTRRDRAEYETNRASPL